MTATSHRWLALRLEAPLVAFGGVTIDQVGPTRDYPTLSMLVGLLANALGLRRTDVDATQSLQDRLIFAACYKNSEQRITDVQNVTMLERTELGVYNCGWTSGTLPEVRSRSDAPHRRRRDYLADACMMVVLRLDPDVGSPDLDAIATALDRPARPLFIGRKSCLPASRIFAGEVMAPTAYAALRQIDPPTDDAVWRAFWPAEEGPTTGDGVDRVYAICDARNWRTGLHGGSRPVVEGRLRRTENGQ